MLSSIKWGWGRSTSSGLFICNNLCMISGVTLVIGFVGGLIALPYGYHSVCWHCLPSGIRIIIHGHLHC